MLLPDSAVLCKIVPVEGDLVRLALFLDVSSLMIGGCLFFDCN